MFEPVVPDERGLSQGGCHVVPKVGRPLSLGCDQRPAAIGVRQAGIRTAKRKLADQAGLAGGGIGVNRVARIDVIAIDRDEVGVARGCIDNAGRRHVGEPAAEQEMVGIGGFDGRAGQREITLRHERLRTRRNRP